MVPAPVTLVVVRPFDSYRRGAVITDAGQVARVLGGPDAARVLRLIEAPNGALVPAPDIPDQRG